MNFSDLQSFLNLYYAAMNVLRTEADFAELTNEYLARAHSQGLVHAEIFFDPQAHTARGVPFRTAIDGLWSAVRNSETHYGVSTRLIMCFPARRERGIGAGDACARRCRSANGSSRSAWIRPNSAIRRASFATCSRARVPPAGKAVAHAGEEGPPAYVWEALDVLGVSRIDHGVRSLEDPKLVDRLRDEQIPLTVCPLSNVKLRVCESLGRASAAAHARCRLARHGEFR